MQPVLFISHYAGRNGAPLVLLELVRWLKAHTRISPHVLFRLPGELERDFASLATVSRLPRLPRTVSAVVRRTLGEVAIERWNATRLRRQVSRLRPSLIYSNTITNTSEVAALAPLNLPVLCHVHEMEYWIRHELGLEKARASVTSVRRFVAVGGKVRDFLVTGLGVPAEAIDIIRPFPATVATRPANTAEWRRDVRRELSVDDSTFLVGACGSVDWRKGADLFLQVARALTQITSGRRPAIKFVWVGGSVTSRFFFQLQHDIEHAGLGAMVRFVGPTSTPARFYAAFDAFLLPSREDPCPLVMMEAAAFELPIVCFQGSGGAPEFVADGAGLAVPYLDTRRMAAGLLSLARHQDLGRSFGRAAMQRVRDNHDPDTQCRALFNAMTRAQPLLLDPVSSTA